jgi:hypothetical protein
VVGGTVSERQPPLTPPYQGGESFSCQVVSRRIMESVLRLTHSEFPDTFSGGGLRNLSINENRRASVYASRFP